MEQKNKDLSMELEILVCSVENLIFEANTVLEELKRFQKSL